jgi:CheY-like chemotaxis protein
LNWHLRPACATGANEALQILRQARDQGDAFKLVITDGQMPEVDGFLFAEWIKRDPTLAESVIMMLTSGDQHGNVARCERLGIAAYLLKPAKQSELFDAIILAMHPTVPVVGQQELTSEPALPEYPVLRILLAEDSLVNQKLAIGLLERHGYEVSVANNGKETVAATTREKFDLVLMDVQMPEMDGMEATAMIRANECKTGEHLPIVAMTAHAMKGDREACLAAGMDGYIAKPIRASKLFDTIAAVLRQRREEPPRNSGLPRLDWSKAVETVQGDIGLLRDIVTTFLDECPRMLEGIQQSLAGHRCRDLQLAAHTLKGSMRYFGAKVAFDRAYELECQARDGKLQTADVTLQSLRAELEQIKPDLQAFASTGKFSESVAT